MRKNALRIRSLSPSPTLRAIISIGSVPSCTRGRATSTRSRSTARAGVSPLSFRNKRANWPSTDPCGLGHSFDGKRLVQMFSGEFQCVPDPIGSRLELKHGRKLRLTARSTMIDDHVPCDRLRYIDTEIVLDQSQRQVDACRDTSRCPDIAILRIDPIGVNTHFRKTSLQFGSVSPMGRCYTAIE